MKIAAFRVSTKVWVLAPAIILLSAVHGEVRAETCLVASGGSGGAFAPSTTAFACGQTSVAVSGGSAFGANATASGEGSVSIGFDSDATGEQATAVGQGSLASGEDATALGAGSVATGDDSVALGVAADATGELSTAVGPFATASGLRSFAGGVFSTADGIRSLALGHLSEAAGTESIAIGSTAEAAEDNSIAIGRAVTATRENQVALGNTFNTYTFAGIASAAGLAAQTGAIEVVTTDANGNLSTDDGALALRLFRSNREAGLILLAAIALGAVSVTL